MKNLKIIVVLLIIIIVGIIVFWFNLNSITKESLKKYGSEATKSNLNISQVEISVIGSGKIISSNWSDYYVHEYNSNRKHRNK